MHGYRVEAAAGSIGKIGRRSSRYLVSAALGLVALLANGVLGLSNLHSVAAAEGSVGDTRQVLGSLESLLSTLKDAETGQRGYIITGERRYLEPYQAAVASVQSKLARLQALTRDNPEAQQQVDAMRPLVDAKLVELKQAINLRAQSVEPSRGLEAARDFILTDQGKDAMDMLRARTATLFIAERELLAEREIASERAVRTAVRTSFAGLAASILLVGTTFAFFRRGLLDQQRAADGLYAEGERLRRTLTSMGDAVIVTDDKGRITLMNAVARTLVAWDDRALGRPLVEVFRIVNEDTHETLQDPVVTVLRADEVTRLANHTVLLARDGTEVPIDDSAAPVRDHEGRVLGVVLVFRDARENRRAERAFCEQSELLARMDQRIDEFLAVLSHELRNPLTPIRNSTYLLRQSHALDPRGQRAAEVIDRQVGYLAHMVDDLLDVARISRGQIRLRCARIDLVQLVSQALDDYSSLLQRHLVDVELPPQAVWVHGDATRLSQSVGNVLDNATKFTPEGNRVRIVLAKATSCARIEVTDTGSGISPDLLCRLFEPFSQAERTLDRSSGGLGLGLSLVKGLVELHGGKVLAQSGGVEQGTKITIELPLDEQPFAEGATCQETPTMASSKKVLVIEDNVDVADSLRDVLELLGHSVAVAYNGPEGLAVARELGPDVVLCDIGLPGMDGYDVARTMRAEPIFEHVHLVSLSGYAQPDDLRRASEAGFEHHLVKPPAVAQLKSLLANL